MTRVSFCVKTYFHIAYLYSKIINEERNCIAIKVIYMRYEIIGSVMPVVEVTLEDGEQIKCERGAMTWMTDNMQMETKAGGFGKMFARSISGEAMFQNIYTARGHEGKIALGSSYPGNIRAVELHNGESIICQKTAYLGSYGDININIAFQKRFKGGFFGGEGFIMQKISGEGTVFLEIDGETKQYMLEPGEKMVIDTGYLAIMDGTCTMDAETVKGGVKNVLFGGEGLFNTTVVGPGRIILQTMPRSQFAAMIYQMMPKSNNN